MLDCLHRCPVVPLHNLTQMWTGTGSTDVDALPSRMSHVIYLFIYLFIYFSFSWQSRNIMQYHKVMLLGRDEESPPAKHIRGFSLNCSLTF